MPPCLRQLQPCWPHFPDLTERALARFIPPPFSPLHHPAFPAKPSLWQATAMHSFTPMLLSTIVSIHLHSLHHDIVTSLIKTAQDGRQQSSSRGKQGKKSE